MSGQGVRTHHQMAVEVNDPDNISGQDMLSFGCDVHECRVLLPERVWIGEHATCPLGESGWSCSEQPGGAGHFHIGNSVRRNFTSGIPSADISHPKFRPPTFSHPEFRPPTFHIRNSVRRHFIAGWERRTFQLLRSDLFGSSDSAYQESFSLSIQCHGVLLKLPNISDRYPEIFCFRYLLSKSPKSPCNPPIIGFLSL